MEFNELIDAIKDYSTVVLDKAGELGKMAASKTDTAVKKAKTKYGIAEVESKQRKIYEAIGEKVYSDYKSGQSVEGFDDKLAQLDALSDEAEELKRKLAEYKYTIRCDACGGYSDSESVYCSKCGAKLKDEISETADDEDVIEVEPADSEG